MQAIINGTSLFKSYAGEVFEIKREKDGICSLVGIFSENKFRLSEEDIAKEEDGKIEILEAPYSRDPERDFLTVKLVYSVYKQEFITFLYNKQSGGFTEGHYFIPEETTLKGMKKAFNEAFNDFLDR